ncbi:hypothetical protein HY345_03580 [Candidatus Microgenomates bacterium]|nr:hypothetical protein [Candidatus Microgenomates bacterium]
MFKKDLITIFILSTAAFLLSNFAQFWGILHTPSDMVFLGGHLPSSGEILSMVYSQMRDGEILTKNLFTSESQARIFFAPSYLPLVMLAKFLPFSDLQIFLLGKFFYSITFVFLFWKYLSLEIKNSTGKIWSCLLLLFSSGVGFLVNFFAPQSIDLWIPEANVFHTILYTPSFIYFQIIILGAFYVLSKFLSSRQKIYLLYLSFLLLLLAFEHQFSLFTVFLAVFLYLGFLQDRKGNPLSFLPSFLVTFGPALLVIVGQFFLIKQYPDVEAWTKQTNLSNPSLFSFVTGFGLIGILAFKNIFTASWERMSPFYRLNLFWLLSSLLLVFSPLPFQRRFLEGVFIPLVIFAAPEISAIYQKGVLFFKRKTSLAGRLFLPVLFVLVSSTNLYLVYQDLTAFSRQQQESPFFIYVEDQKGLAFLKATSRESDIILADGFYSPLIPGLINRTVYFGHAVGTALTINPEQKTFEVKGFFLEDNDYERKGFLKKNNIKYLFLGKKGAEAQDFGKWDEKKYLKKIYQGDGVKIFRVI